MTNDCDEYWQLQLLEVATPQAVARVNQRTVNTGIADQHTDRRQPAHSAVPATQQRKKKIAVVTHKLQSAVGKGLIDPPSIEQRLRNC